jgi:hypothetical protein
MTMVRQSHLVLTLASSLALGLLSCAKDDRVGEDGLFGEGDGDGGDAGDAGDGGDDGGTGGDGGDGGDDGGDGGDGGDDGDDGGGPLFDVGNDSTGDPPGTGEGCEYIDILFLVDISASMMQEKQNLSDNFPNFVGVLDAYIANPDKEALGYRIGVTNTSINADHGGCATTMGLDGELFAGGGMGGDCGTDGTPWLDSPDADMPDNFTCLGNNPMTPGGGSDCGHERPLDTTEYFISKHVAGGANEGFYRKDNSLFVLVILTDEDDDFEWTTTTPTQTKAALDGFAGGEERYVVVTIAGPEDTGCESDFGSADATPILHEFDSLVPNSTFGDICLGNLAPALADALELIQISCDQLPPVG